MHTSKNEKENKLALLKIDMISRDKENQIKKC